MQAVPQVGSLFFLVAVLVVVSSVAVLVIEVLRRRWRAVRGAGLALGVFLLIYTAALVGAGMTSSPRHLAVGDTKCFDDWCAQYTGARRAGTGADVLVTVRLENHSGGRAMRSNLARAYIQVAGHETLSPADGSAMQTVVDANGHADIQLTFDGAAAVAGARFVVAEGSDSLGPGNFTIGDEVSPFHARAGWPLVLS